MKVWGLDNKQHKINLSQYTTARSVVSGNHETARLVLKELYPVDQILEEMPLPGCLTNLYLDFFLPLRKLAIEVQGEQHYSFNAHFHGTQDGFKRAKARDSQKRMWCDLNGIRLVALDHKNVENWKAEILAL